MSLRINHNPAAINSHRNLEISQKAMGKTLERLSSGLKINRASEGPASLVISEQMRAQIAGLSQAIDNSETAISMVQTTEANMAEINNLLVSMRQLAIHASNEGVNDEVMLEADQREIENALKPLIEYPTKPSLVKSACWMVHGGRGCDHWGELGVYFRVSELRGL